MSRRQHNAPNLDSRFPRVSGDEPFGFTNRDGSIGFSPRERG